MECNKKEIKVGHRGHKTCSIIRGKIRPKVKFDRRCRTDWVPDIHRIYARMHAGYMSDICRIYVGLVKCIVKDTPYE